MSSSLAHLSDNDRELFYKFGFGSKAPQLPFPTVHQAFGHHATTHPSSIAVEHGADTITYAELHVRSNRLAATLRKKGVHPGSRVCILGSRGINLITGILGVVKAGGQYVPLDGGIVTDSTLQYVLKDSEATMALTLRAFEHRLPERFPRLVIENEIEAGLTDHPAEVLPMGDLSQPNDG